MSVSHCNICGTTIFSDDDHYWVEDPMAGRILLCWKCMEKSDL